MRKAVPAAKRGSNFHSQISFATNLTVLNKTLLSPGVKSDVCVDLDGFCSHALTLITIDGCHFLPRPV